MQSAAKSRLAVIMALVSVLAAPNHARAQPVAKSPGRSARIAQTCQESIAVLRSSTEGSQRARALRDIAFCGPDAAPALSREWDRGEAGIASLSQLIFASERTGELRVLDAMLRVASRPTASPMLRQAAILAMASYLEPHFTARVVSKGSGSDEYVALTSRSHPLRVDFAPLGSADVARIRAMWDSLARSDDVKIAEAARLALASMSAPSTELSAQQRETAARSAVGAVLAFRGDVMSGAAAVDGCSLARTLGAEASSVIMRMPNVDVVGAPAATANCQVETGEHHPVVLVDSITTLDRTADSAFGQDRSRITVWTTTHVGGGGARLEVYSLIPGPANEEPRGWRVTEYRLLGVRYSDSVAPPPPRPPGGEFPPSGSSAG